jgi:hypothetical protein
LLAAATKDVNKRRRDAANEDLAARRDDLRVRRKGTRTFGTDDKRDAAGRQRHREVAFPFGGKREVAWGIEGDFAEGGKRLLNGDEVVAARHRSAAAEGPEHPDDDHNS